MHATAIESAQFTQHESDQLAGRVAHDLQSVLQTIEGFAAVLQTRGQQGANEKDRYYLQRIRDNALRGNALVHAMLGFYRLATCDVEHTRVDLGELVARVRARVSPAADAKPVTWRVAGALPAIQGDVALVEQVVWHLLSNAIKFARTDGRPATVEISATSVQGFCELCVRDDGVGYDPADSHRLFRPLERLHGDPYEGIGMGLATVKRIIERHGGSVRAEHAPGGGSVFVVGLPLAPADDKANMRAAPEALPPGRQSILLIDDDPMVLVSVASMLERSGYRVTTAPGGGPGMVAFDHALRENAYDIVITDWGMPGLSGERVAQAVKKMRPETAVLVITGNAPEVVHEEMSNVDGVLGKPLRMAQLRSALSNLSARQP